MVASYLVAKVVYVSSNRGTRIEGATSFVPKRHNDCPSFSLQIAFLTSRVRLIPQIHAAVLAAPSRRCLAPRRPSRTNITLSQNDLKYKHSGATGTRVGVVSIEDITYQLVPKVHVYKTHLVLSAHVCPFPIRKV